MPESDRPRRSILGQGGSALLELLVVMPVAIILLFVILQTFLTSATRQREISARTEVVRNAQIGLGSMTREVRQASWIHFTSSQVIDLDTLARVSGSSSSAVHRHVRYDCSRQACVRSEGPAVSFPPPAGSIFEKSGVVVGAPTTDRASLFGRLGGHAVFLPRRIDETTGASRQDYLNPDMLLIRLLLRVPGQDRPLEIEDGVSLRNTTRFGG